MQAFMYEYIQLLIACMSDWVMSCRRWTLVVAEAISAEAEAPVVSELESDVVRMTCSCVYIPVYALALLACGSYN